MAEFKVRDKETGEVFTVREKSSSGGVQQESSPKNAMQSFLNANVGGTPNIDRIAGLGAGGLPAAVLPPKNIEDYATIPGQIAGNAAGGAIGHPILGGMAGVATAQAGRQGIKALRNYAEGEPQSSLGSNALDVAIPTALTGGMDALISGVTKAPFSAEWAGKAIKQSASKIGSLYNRFVKSGVKVSSEEVFTDLYKLKESLGLDSEKRLFDNKIIKELYTEGKDIALPKLKGMFQKLNQLTSSAYRQKNPTMTGDLKYAYSQARDYLSKLIQSKAKEAGIPELSQEFAKIASLNKFKDFLSGGTGKMGGSIGGISAGGAIGALADRKAGGSGATGAIMGSLGGVALANPMVRNMLFQAISSNAGQAGTLASRASSGEILRKLAEQMK